jgi:zinc transport system substrate-binding protein
MNKAIILLFILVLALSGCKQEKATAPGKAVVSVSISPQQYLIECIAGELVEVNVMVPPGASPATYEPTVTQMAGLTHSELYLMMGYLGFELSWMDKIRSVNPGMEVIDLSRGIMLIDGAQKGDDPDRQYDSNRKGALHGNHVHSGTDPHIWMSARNMKKIATTSFEALLTLLPSEKEYLSYNYDRFMLELDTLDRAIGEMLSGEERKSFMIYHPSLGYFARDYGLEQLALELEGKTPSPAHMKRMSDLGKNKGVHTLFIQKEFDQHNASVLAREIGAQLVQIDPLDPEWNKQMLHIASQLKASF